MSNKAINIAAELEQLEQTLVDSAIIIASYYKKLIDAGIPVELANSLVIDWHRIFWSQGKNDK